MTDTNASRVPKHTTTASHSSNNHRPEDNHAKSWLLANKALSAFAIIVAIFWPVLRWVLSIDVFFKFVLMLWHWNTPGSHAGWTFALHVGLLVSLILFLANHKSAAHSPD